jgi:hypothetical protein
MNALGPCGAIDAIVPISVGQEFDCFQDFKATVYEWAMSSDFPLWLEKSDRLRNVFCCKTAADCEFKVQAIWKANEER